MMLRVDSDRHGHPATTLRCAGQERHVTVTVTVTMTVMINQ
jgi:hypothetical protein